jgi:hypothetical protein
MGGFGRIRSENVHLVKTRRAKKWNHPRPFWATGRSVVGLTGCRFQRIGWYGLQSLLHQRFHLYTLLVWVVVYALLPLSASIFVVLKFHIREKMEKDKLVIFCFLSLLYYYRIKKLITWRVYYSNTRYWFDQRIKRCIDIGNCINTLTTFFLFVLIIKLINKIGHLPLNSMSNKIRPHALYSWHMCYNLVATLHHQSRE